MIPIRRNIALLGFAARRGVRARRDSGLHLAAVLVVLSVGVGCHLAISLVWDSVFVRSWPYDSPMSLVDIRVMPREGRLPASGSAFRTHLDSEEVATLRRLSSSFSWIGPYLLGEVQVGEETHSPFRMAAILSPGMLDALGTEGPILGRAFRPDDHIATHSSRFAPRLPVGVAQPVALLSHSLWSSVFGASPEAVGQTVILDGVSVEVIGVMPPGFFFPFRSVAMWLPMREARPSPHGEGPRISGPIVGRLRPEVSSAVAGAEVMSLLRNMDFREENERAHIVPVSKRMTEGVRPALVLLRAGGWLFLLMGAISCAGLRLSRTAANLRQDGIRFVLGASLGDEIVSAIVRVVVLTGLVFLGGTVLSLFLAEQLSRFFPHLPLAGDWPLGAQLLASGFAATFLAACVTEAPATATTLKLRRNPMAPHSLADVGGKRTRLALLATVVAVATTVASLTATLGTSAWGVLAGRGGYADTNLVQITVDFRGRSRTAPISHWEKTAALENAAARLARLPVVGAVGYADTLPDEAGGMRAASSRTGRREDPVEYGPYRAVRAISPGLLGVLGLTIRNGREFDPADNAPTERVVILDRNYARSAEEAVGVDSFPHVSGIGKARVVGISEPVERFPSGGSMPTAYRPFSLDTNSPAGLRKAEIVVRLNSAPDEDTVAALALVPGAADPLLRVRRAESVRSRRIRMLGISVLAGGALALFCAGGLLITVAGAAGAVLGSVADQSRATAIRRALGASDDVVVREVARRTLVALVGGCVFGFALGWAASRLVANRIPWVETGNFGLTFIPGGFVLLLTITACLGFAWRAVRADPWEALSSP